MLVIDTHEKAEALLAKLRRLPGPFGIDTECVVDIDRSPVGQGTIVCWSLAWVDTGNLHARGMPLASRAFLWAEYLDLFKPWLEDSSIGKVGHNVFTFDRHLFLNHGISLQGIVGDTLRMSRFLNADSSAQHGLKSLMERVLGYQPVGEYKQLFGRQKAAPVEDAGEGKLTRRKLEGCYVPSYEGDQYQRLFTATELIDLHTVRTDYAWLLPTLYDYASLDAKATLELFYFFRTLMQKRPAKRLGAGEHGTLWDLYEGWWNPGLLQLTEYERAGIDVSDAACTKVADLIDADIAPLAKVVESWAPGVNWRSSKQYAEFLYEKKRFPVPPYCGSKPEAAKRTKRGKTPGDFVALSWIADRTQTGPDDKAGLRAVLALKKLVNDRRFAVDLGTYRALDGRVHTVLAPEADTGRLSSKTPCVHQLPKRDKYKVRRAVVAPPGYKLIVADYSQLEMYVAAHFMNTICEDSTLADMLAAGDMHSSMALRAWPHELKGLSAQQIKEHIRRDHAKAVGYGLFYGKSAAGMGISIRDESGSPIGTPAAQAILDAYHAAVPALAVLQEHFKAYAREHWGVHTLLGRFRPIPEVKSDDEWQRGEGERAALNTPIQGTAADIVTTAMLRSNTTMLPDLQSRGFFHAKLAALGAIGNHQVHDELGWRVPEANAEAAAVLVKQIMENPFKPGVLSVPLKADVHVGSSWGDCK